MTQPLREDCWGRMVEPRDSTMGEWFDRGPQPVVFCDLCAVAHPADPDIEAVTGMWVCQPCIEATLEGACS